MAEARTACVFLLTEITTAKLRTACFFVVGSAAAEAGTASKLFLLGSNGILFWITAAEAGTASNFFLAGSTALEARPACFFFWWGPRRRRQGWHVFFWRGPRWRRRGRHVLSFGGDHGGEGWGGIFLAGSTAEDARMARILFLVRRAAFVIGSGTAEVIRHRRRDLRAGRLPLRLFGSDRNDDSQFSSRLALRW